MTPHISLESADLSLRLIVAGRDERAAAVNGDDQPLLSRSWATARRTVILATPYCWDRSASLGSRVSGACRPVLMSASMSRATWVATGTDESSVAYAPGQIGHPVTC